MDISSSGTSSDDREAAPPSIGEFFRRRWRNGGAERHVKSELTQIVVLVVLAVVLVGAHQLGWIGG